ncbi:MAG: type II secretion system F family protein [Chloroflexi bacterium]|nr:type II secretion system F family protein [Chloroflexota bacterium]
MSNLVLLIPLVVFAATGLLVFAVYRLQTQKRETVRARLAHYDMDIGASAMPLLSTGVLREQGLSSIGALDALLTWGGAGERMALDLARAAIPLRVGEYVLLRWLMAVALFVVGYVSASPLAGLLLGIVGYFLPRFYVRRSEQKRIKKFEDQLVDSLALIANSLRSGFGLLQGMEAVAREMPAPISEEFEHVLHQMRVGASAEDALAGIGKRVRSPDLDLVVTAMLIQRTVGGNLSEILDNIAHTIRERVRLLRMVRTLTAQERLGGYILTAMPVFLLVIISLLNPHYSEVLFTTTIGRLMLAMAAGLDIAGLAVSRKIMAIEV